MVTLYAVTSMNVYYQIHPFCRRKEHISFIINKREMHYWGKSLPSIVRYLIGIVRDRDGLLGLVEDRGSEYWMTTVIPVRSEGPMHQHQSHSPSYRP